MEINRPGVASEYTYLGMVETLVATFRGPDPDGLEAIRKFKAAADLTPSRIFDKIASAIKSGFAAARAAGEQAVAIHEAGILTTTCGLGPTCRQHNPPKAEPFVPRVDDFDLLPDA